MGKCTYLRERLGVVQVRLQQMDERQADVGGGRLAETVESESRGWGEFLFAFITSQTLFLPVEE